MEKSGEKSLDVLNIAIKQESDGIKFYTEAAGKCKHHLGKAMFKSFADDEKEHLKRLEKLQETEMGSFKDDGLESKIVCAKERLLSVFTQMKDRLESTIQPESDDMEALKVAIELERTGHRLYETAYDETNDARAKELYKFLAKEEIIHYEILRNTYNYLNNVDKLHAKDEDRGYDLWARMINEV
ncbi:MAG: ferritin-like domain-containing protein [Candidatus Anammoxibacter sp.]